MRFVLKTRRVTTTCNSCFQPHMQKRYYIIDTKDFPREITSSVNKCAAYSVVKHLEKSPNEKQDFIGRILET